MFRSLSCAFALLLSTTAVVGQQMATDVRVDHRYGQSFIVWREIAATPSPTLYRVWRSSQPIQTASNLVGAELLGEQRAGSYWNARAGRPFRLSDVAPPLKQGEGYLVATVPRAQTSYYAVTASWNGLENRTIDTRQGGNSVGPIVETPQAIRPVLQAVNGIAEEYVEFLPDRPNGFVGAHANRGGRALNYQLVVDRRLSGPRPVVLVFHSRGGTWKTARVDQWLPANAIQIAFDDDNDPYLTSLWFGYHEAFPGGPARGKVVDYTERRVLWTLRQVLADASLQADAQRVYCFGFSFGAMAALGLGTRYSDVIAACGGSVPAFGLEHADFSLRPDVVQLFGTRAQDLDSTLGEKIWDVFDYRAQIVKRGTSGTAPMWFTLGRADTVTGWSEKPDFMRTARDHAQPMRFYWDLRSHATTGPWTTLEGELFKELLDVRLDRPVPCFAAPSIDDDAGDGSRIVGDKVGSIGGYVAYDATSVVDSPSKIEFVYSLRSDATRLDYSSAPTAFVDLVVRRVRNFSVVRGSLYRLQSYDVVSNTLVEERYITTDARGLLTVSNLLATHGKRRLVIEPSLLIPPVPHVGGSLVPAGYLEISLHALPNQVAVLFYGVVPGLKKTPWGELRILDPTILYAGLTPGSGFLRLGAKLPNDPGLRGLKLQAQALVNLAFTPAAGARFR